MLILPGIFMVIAIVIAVGTFMSACGPFPPTQQQAAEAIDAMRFVKHANGLCFGVVQFETYGGMRGVAVTVVPDRACGPEAETAK